ncbi:hypothetical protein [Flavobacterium orientale]|uniref:Uncharacterized protein n=1 Tax=Flavobacterium orientale TaxID=1756020 RepID=A0A916XWP8_9FLAO|nr:hypothetical protein [Flavobacterium orientale]GGD17628.1 hypothetical protein GCM10011343_05430 [Flavobacterium orientale]
MEILNKPSFQKGEEMLWAEMNFENKITMPSHFEKKIMVFGICSNCLNNNNCVWMQNEKIECEEYS